MLVACEQELTNRKEIVLTESSISASMKCNNCKVNLQKYISTNHFLKLKNKDEEFYCSLNCLAEEWNKVKDNIETVYVIDTKTKVFFPANEAYYVLRNTFGKDTLRITAYGYKEIEYAKRFKTDFLGKEIVKFDRAIKLTKDKIEKKLL